MSDTREYTYMSPSGYPNDYAGLPSGDLSFAQEVAKLFPGMGVLYYREAATPWAPLDGAADAVDARTEIIRAGLVRYVSTALNEEKKS